MNDEQIIDALRGSDTAARPLDPRRVIAGARRRQQRGRMAGVAVVTAVAGTAAVASFHGLGRAVDQLQPAQGRQIEVTLGRLSAAEATRIAARCPHGAGEPANLVHPVRVLDPERPDIGTLVVRNDDGTDYGCFESVLSVTAVQTPRPLATGKSKPMIRGEVLSGTTPTAEDPVVDTTVGEVSFALGSGLEVSPLEPIRVTVGRFYRVDERVAQLRQRYVVDGKAGPWFVADAVDGYVYLRSWLDRPLVPGDRATIETQALGHDGNLVEDSDLSRERSLRVGPNGEPEVDG